MSCSFAREAEERILISEPKLRRRAAAGERFRIRFTLADEEGKRRWLEAVGQPIGGDGPNQGGVVVLHDLTDLSLRVLQDEFVALVTHELRTPLTALSGYLELLHRRQAAGDDEPSQRYASRALRHTGRLTQLVGDLFDASRLQHHTLKYDFPSPFGSRCWPFCLPPEARCLHPVGREGAPCA